jgi:hypothetical protein
MKVVKNSKIPEMRKSPSFENSIALTQPKCETKSFLKRFFAIDNLSLNNFD